MKNLPYSRNFLTLHSEELLIHYCLVNLYAHMAKQEQEAPFTVKGLRVALSHAAKRWKLVAKAAARPTLAIRPTLPLFLRLTPSQISRLAVHADSIITNLRTEMNHLSRHVSPLYNLSPIGTYLDHWLNIYHLYQSCSTSSRHTNMRSRTMKNGCSGQSFSLSSSTNTMPSPMQMHTYIVRAQ